VDQGVLQRFPNGDLVNRALRTYDAQGRVIEEKQILDNLETIIPSEARAKMLDESGLSADQLRQELRAQLTKLMVPADLQGQLGTTTHCTGCHATHNIGNNPSATFFARVGTDSLDILNQLLSNTNLSSATLANLAVYQQEVSQLPQYCLRPKSSVSSASCGSVPGDVVTTDPGHAMVSGHIADVGKFKPPILRGLAARSPYFHAGTAQNIQMLIHFYNARFQIGLTEDEVNDLGAFLEAQ